MVKEVPVGAVWSVTAYSADGALEPNELGRILNDPFRRLRRRPLELHRDHARLEPTVRLYAPRAEILDGSWHFPKPEPGE